VGGIWPTKPPDAESAGAQEIGLGMGCIEPGQQKGEAAAIAHERRGAFGLPFSLKEVTINIRFGTLTNYSSQKKFQPCRANLRSGRAVGRYGTELLIL